MTDSERNADMLDELTGPHVGESALVRMIDASLAFEALNRLPVGLFVLDAEARFVLSTGGGQASLGLLSERVVGMSVDEVYSDHPEIVRAVWQALGGVTVECRIAIGESAYRASLEPIMREGVVDGVIGVALDISERERSEQLLASVVEQSTDAIIIASSPAQIMRLNPAAERMFGYRADELLQADLTRLMPEFRPEQKGGLRGHADVLAGVADRWLRLRGLRADGSEFPLDLHLSDVRRGPEPIFVAVIRDATEEEAARQLRDTLVDSVSHEFRTPIAAISMFLELARSSSGVPEEVVSFLRTIERNLDRLERLVDDILLLRADAGGFAAVDETVDLMTVVAGAVDSVRPAAVRADIRLTFHRTSGPPLRGDPVRLGQLFDNLLGNAVKFTQPGGAIRTCSSFQDNEWTVSVTNSGLIIPPRELATIFAPFSRGTTAVTAGIPGKGLGLAIAKAIVEEHGGSIDLASSATAGTVVTVHLPLAHDAPVSQAVQ